MYKRLQEIKNYCQQYHRDKELWPSYYERRYLEFLTIAEHFPQKRLGKVLELGCGIGYYSAFLSTLANEVISTDLESFDPTTHSPGLQLTRSLLKELQIENVTVQHASAECLPFEDNSFDMVFSSHVLEHIPDGEKAIQEINRVLKPGGINFCVVPTTTDRILILPAYYLYLAERAFHHMAGKYITPKKKSSEVKIAHINSNPVQNLFSIYLKHFPLPPPHGVLSSYLQELKYWRLAKWKKFVTQNGSIAKCKQVTAQLNPVLPLLGNLLPSFAVACYRQTRKLENKLARNNVLRHLGISTILITHKSSELKHY